MIDKDTVKRIAEESGILKRFSPDIETPQLRDAYSRRLEQLQAFATAILKEAQAGNEPVATVGLWDVIHWQVPQIEIPIGTKFYTTPPTQEVEALKAKLEAVIPVLHEMKMIAPRAIKGGHVFASEFTCVDNALATIDNTNELQEPNTGSE